MVCSVKPDDFVYALVLHSINPIRKAETVTRLAMAEKGVETGEKSLKEKGNEFFKAGNYLKAAALYTQAIKLDPSNATLYRQKCSLF